MGRETAEERKRRLAKNKYMRNWRKKNPEKVKQHKERFWDKKAKEFKKEGENKDDNR